MSESTAPVIAATEVQSSVMSNGGPASFVAEPRPLRTCVYISVACAPCECVRVALAETPNEEVIACPACGRPSVWTLLARGATVRPLPFYQRMRLGEDRKGQSRVPWTIYDTYGSEEEKEELEG